MTYDDELFKELDKAVASRVRIRNGDYLAIKGKRTVAIEISAGTKLISDVLFVPDIDQNLLSMPQLLKKDFKIIFEAKTC